MPCMCFSIKKKMKKQKKKKSNTLEIRSYSFVRVAKISLVRLMSVKPTSCTKRGGFVYFRIAIFILSFSFFFFRHEMSFLSTAISARAFIASTVLSEMRLFLVCRSALETIFQTSCKRGCSLFNKL